MNRRRLHYRTRLTLNLLLRLDNNLLVLYDGPLGLTHLNKVLLLLLLLGMVLHLDDGRARVMLLRLRLKLWCCITDVL